ncbi:helix-turn-helix transcriptional regulator [Paenibacillus glufosinatiresistens]|uniref:helix-turn-helix transcriptional regulator n=1 Tax=Paenibacillus glufosinatiresistens TaxID=3070657 RepID=UPI00286E569B|nr:AraC family transcriptional regulator [Paenibacillus sp. YX.27]
MNQIHYVETNATHESDFVFDIPQGHQCWLLVITKTPALFRVNGELKEYPAHHVILYEARQPIYYRACGNVYINDWLRFSSDEIYISRTSLPYGIPFALDDPDYCSKLFELLVVEHNFNRNCQESSIDSLLRILFNKLQESYWQGDLRPQYYNLQRLRTAIQTNPGDPWTVSRMAQSLQLSPGYLQSIYKKTFGISCMEDVINSRIRLAKEYLYQNTLSVAEVAFRCGYRNIEHFCRQFKRVTGYSPGRYQLYKNDPGVLLPNTRLDRPGR